MQPHRPPDGITEADYEAIEDAVMETARGRWFLKEYARRMRAAETAGLLSVLERIEKMVKSSGSASTIPEEMLPAQAASQIEKISERLLDISWYMRERGIDGSACSAIDSEARQLAALLPDAVADEASGVGESDHEQSASDFANESIIIDEQAHEEIAERAAPIASVEIVSPVSAEPEIIAEPAKAEVVAPVIAKPSLAERAVAFIHIDRMPVKQKLALFG